MLYQSYVGEYNNTYLYPRIQVAFPSVTRLTDYSPFTWYIYYFEQRVWCIYRTDTNVRLILFSVYNSFYLHRAWYSLNTVVLWYTIRLAVL